MDTVSSIGPLNSLSSVQFRWIFYINVHNGIDSQIQAVVHVSRDREGDMTAAQTHGQARPIWREVERSTVLYGSDF